MTQHTTHTTHHEAGHHAHEAGHPSHTTHHAPAHHAATHPEKTPQEAPEPTKAKEATWDDYDEAFDPNDTEEEASGTEQVVVDEEEKRVPFSTLPLSPVLLDVAAKLGYTHATFIQERTVPLIKDGRDVVGQSPTGSGKTVAFGLPILERITPGQGIQALILTPTRELCVQITEVLTEFAKPLGVTLTSIYGGVDIEPQKRALRHADLVIATPGRTLDHLGQRTIDLGGVRFLVIDEADKMFEMGFIDDVERIMGTTQLDRQTLMFTATLVGRVRSLMERNMRQPEIVRIHSYVDPNDLHQTFYDVNPGHKFSLLVHLLKSKTKGLAIVFCAARHEVDTLTHNLQEQGVKAIPIHGGIDQAKRLKAIQALRDEQVDVLVATDVAARGLDIKHISHVYNFTLPKTSEEYVHRIGRTARAGESGDAVTILTPDDHENFRRILTDHSLNVDKLEVPQFPQLPFFRPQRRRMEYGMGGMDRGPRDRPMHRDGGFARQHPGPAHRPRGPPRHHSAGPAGPGGARPRRR